jgi:hypothetical protein
VHRLLLLIGVGFVLAGLVLSFVPLFSGPSQVLTPSHPTAAFNATMSISLTPQWTIGLSWSSNQRVSLLVVVCSSINTSASSMQAVCPGAALTVLNGTGGTGTFSVPFRGALLIGIVSALGHDLRVNVQLRPTLVSVGTLFVIGGAAAIAVGVLWRRKRQPSPSSGPKATERPNGPGH